MGVCVRAYVRECVCVCVKKKGDGNISTIGYKPVNILIAIR